MAKNTSKKASKTPADPDAPSARPSSAGAGSRLRFSGINLILGIAGLACVSLGYVLLAQGSITAAPLLLVLGYVGLLPLAIIL